jgi:hypothetical protein
VSARKRNRASSRKSADWRSLTVGELVDAFSEYARLVRDGADPIEAMHSHLCGPNCWHEQMKSSLKSRRRS